MAGIPSQTLDGGLQICRDVNEKPSHPPPRSLLELFGETTAAERKSGMEGGWGEFLLLFLLFEQMWGNRCEACLSFRSCHPQWLLTVRFEGQSPPPSEGMSFLRRPRGLSVTSHPRSWGAPVHMARCVARKLSNCRPPLPRLLPPRSRPASTVFPELLYCQFPWARHALWRIVGNSGPVRHWS